MVDTATQQTPKMAQAKTPTHMKVLYIPPSQYKGVLTGLWQVYCTLDSRSSLSANFDCTHIYVRTIFFNHTTMHSLTLNLDIVNIYQFIA